MTARKTAEVMLRKAGVSSGNSLLLCSSSALVLESRIQAYCTPQPATSLIHRSYQRL